MAQAWQPVLHLDHHRSHLLPVPVELASFRFRYRLLSLPRLFCLFEPSHQMYAITASSRMVMQTSLRMPQPPACPSYTLPGVTMTRHASTAPRHCLSMAMGRQAWCLHVYSRVMACWKSLPSRVTVSGKGFNAVCARAYSSAIKVAQALLSYGRVAIWNLIWRLWHLVAHPCMCASR
jgi:hypothetical protein